MLQLGLFHMLRLLAVVAGLVIGLWLAFTPVSVVALDDRSFGGECGYFWQQGSARLGDPDNRCAAAGAERMEQVTGLVVSALAMFVIPAISRGTNRVVLLVLVALLLIAFLHVRETGAAIDGVIVGFLAATLMISAYYEVKHRMKDGDP